MNIIILAGGFGKRLWPLSTENMPKQFLQIFPHNNKKESMLQRTVRYINNEHNSNFIVATSSSQIDLIKSQLKDIDISIEPCQKDTFPAVCLATLMLVENCGLDSNDPIIVVPVDAWADEGFYRSLNILHEHIKRSESNLSLLGITPNFASTEYGYIKQQMPSSVSKVVEFIEKPPNPTAEKCLKEGWLWNSGVFGFKANYIIDKSFELLGYRTCQSLIDNYSKLKSISFDYAICENEELIDVLKYNGKWKDIGTWDTLSSVVNINRSDFA